MVRLLQRLGEALDGAWSRLITRGRTRSTRPINMFWDGSGNSDGGTGIAPAPGAIPGVTFAEAARGMAQAQRVLRGAQVKVQVPRAPAVIPPANIDELTNSVQLNKGERVADRVTDVLGSWPFIIGLAVFLGSWFVINAIPWLPTWDPWPWMGANIIMSTMAAFASSLVIIAQKVSSRRDRAFWAVMIRMLTHAEQTADRVEQVLRHVEKIAAADHVEHGNILRDLHSHTTCQGHTTIGDAAQPQLAEIKDLLRLVLMGGRDLTQDQIEEWLTVSKADTQPSLPVAATAAPAAVETAAEPDTAERMRQASRPGTRVVTASGNNSDGSPATARSAKPRRAAKKGVQQ